ncbi:hypothetical protein Emag_004943 [Eimeria magna]
MSLRAANMQDFQHILRVLNTNVDGREKVVIALTAIRGIGRRISTLICKKADIDIDKRAGELSNDEISKIVAIVTSPTQFSIPSWFLNRQKDVKDGKSRHVAANGLDSVWREDFERLKKMRLHRGLRHYWGLKVRGQHTKTTGRHGRTVGLMRLPPPPRELEVLLSFCLFADTPSWRLRAAKTPESCLGDFGVN